MEKALKGNIQGGQLFKKKIAPVLVMVSITFIYFFVLLNYMDSMIVDSISNESNFIAAMTIYLLTSIIFNIIIMGAGICIKYVVTKLTIEGIQLDHSWKMDSSFGGFLKECIKGFLLVIVTVGIYWPWFIRRIINYISDNTSYNGKNIKFLGEGISLFGRMALGIVAMYVIMFILMFGMIFVSFLFGETVGMIFLFVLIYPIQICMVCVIQALFIDWLVDFEYDGCKVKLNKSLFKIALFLTGQLLLTLLTLGIYAPAAMIKSINYLVDALDIENGNKFRFDGKLGEGFLKIWGQFLLTIITLGIYYSWAYAKVMNWFIDHIVFISPSDESLTYDETEETMDIALDEVVPNSIKEIENAQ